MISFFDPIAGMRAKKRMGGSPWTCILLGALGGALALLGPGA
jgi:hypothetical protein